MKSEISQKDGVRKMKHGKSDGARDHAHPFLPSLFPLFPPAQFLPPHLSARQKFRLTQVLIVSVKQSYFYELWACQSSGHSCLDAVAAQIGCHNFSRRVEEEDSWNSFDAVLCRQSRF